MKYRRPIIENACTPVALRNCLLYKGYNYPEKELRKLLKTKKDGTHVKDLIFGLEKLKFKPKIFIQFNQKKFKDSIDKELKEKRTIILVTDSDTHTVSLLEKEKSKYKIVDNLFDKIEQ